MVKNGRFRITENCDFLDRMGSYVAAQILKIIIGSFVSTKNFHESRSPFLIPFTVSLYGVILFYIANAETFITELGR